MKKLILLLLFTVVSYGQVQLPITGTYGDYGKVFTNNSQLGSYSFLVLNNKSGYGSYFQNASTGVLTTFNSITASNGDLMQFRKNLILTSKFDQNGILSTPPPIITTAPTTSAGTYDILTRNSSTGVVEKKLDSDFVHTTNVNETLLGTKTFNNLRLSANANAASAFKLYQSIADSDFWQIYGTSSVTDRGIMVFEVGDNGQAHATGGQKFEFRYNNDAEGTAKTPLTIDYNEITADANVTATSFKTPTGLGTEFMMANGTVTTAPPSQITITTAVSITTATLASNGYGQSGKNTVIDNGVNAINLTVNGGTDFVSSYLKHGTGAITFVQGSGRTLIQVDGTAILNGAVGSTATISSIGTTDYLQISNK